MSFEEELAKADWNALKQLSLEEGREEGLREGSFTAIRILIMAGTSRDDIVAKLIAGNPSLTEDKAKEYLEEYLKENQ